jgi:multidrug efflux pump subunit AcrB
VALKPGKDRIEELKARLREKLPAHLKKWTAEKWKREDVPADVAEARVAELRLSFEPADIVNEVMSFGSPSPIEVVVNGPKMADNRAYAERLYKELANVPGVVDLRYGQALDYPTVEVVVDREKLGPIGATVSDAARAITPYTSSSRFTVPVYWRDPASGVGYQVQVEVPFVLVNSIKDLELAPVITKNGQKVLVRDVGQIKEGTMPGQIDRYNMRRVVSMTANVQGDDLGAVALKTDRAVRATNQSLWQPQFDGWENREGPWKNAISGETATSKGPPDKPPAGVRVDVRGQVAPMREMFGPLAFEPPWAVSPARWFSGLAGGLVVAGVVIFLLLMAYFQSARLALVAVAPVPAVLTGVAALLLATGTTLNLQSFMGAIMALGVATANAILLVTFAERARVGGMNARDAGVEGATSRVRPILMTSCAMIAGMVPMALGVGEGGDQTAPLGRAVVGGLAAGTLTTLFVLPAVFALVMGRASTASASLDPFDPNSTHHVPNAEVSSREVPHAS